MDNFLGMKKGKALHEIKKIFSYLALANRTVAKKMIE
jgi:hypothetical protein